MNEIQKNMGEASPQDVDAHSLAKFGLEIRALENGLTPVQQLEQELQAMGGWLVTHEDRPMLSRPLAKLASLAIDLFR